MEKICNFVFYKLFAKYIACCYVRKTSEKVKPLRKELGVKGTKVKNNHFWKPIKLPVICLNLNISFYQMPISLYLGSNSQINNFTSNDIYTITSSNCTNLISIPNYLF